MEIIKLEVPMEYINSLNTFDLSLIEFLEWCKKNSLFEACAYGKKIEWWR